MAEWFIQKNGKWHGPFPSTRLKALVAQGKLKTSDLIRKGQDGKAVPAGKLNGLFGNQQPETKPIPVPPPLPHSQLTAKCSLASKTIPDVKERPLSPPESPTSEVKKPIPPAARVFAASTMVALAGIGLWFILDYVLDYVSLGFWNVVVLGAVIGGVVQLINECVTKMWSKGIGKPLWSMDIDATSSFGILISCGLLLALALSGIAGDWNHSTLAGNSPDNESNDSNAESAPKKPGWLTSSAFNKGYEHGQTDGAEFGRIYYQTGRLFDEDTAKSDVHNFRYVKDQTGVPYRQGAHPSSDEEYWSGFEAGYKEGLGLGGGDK